MMTPLLQHQAARLDAAPRPSGLAPRHAAGYATTLLVQFHRATCFCSVLLCVRFRCVSCSVSVSSEHKDFGWQQVEQWSACQFFSSSAMFRTTAEGGVSSEFVFLLERVRNGS